MVRAHPRLIPLAALTCLLGQGVLVLAVGRHVDARLPWPFLFLALTCGLAVLTAVSGSIKPPVGTGRLWRVAVLAGLAAVLALGLVIMGQGRDNTTLLEARAATRLEEAVTELALLGPALTEYGRVVGEGRVRPSATADSLGVRGGDPFREFESRIDVWSGLYPRADVLPLRLVVWSGDDRVAWTGDAEPLPAIEDVTSRTMHRTRLGWALREAVPLDDGTLLGCQVVLEIETLRRAWPGLRLYERISEADGRPVRSLGLGPAGGAPHLQVGLDVEAERLRWRATRARVLVALLAAWLVVLTGTLRLHFGWGGAILGLWLGRGLLATVDAHQWLARISTVQSYPADPGGVASLVDPAYFATPFGAGWFASTADVLATSFLLLVTAWTLLRWVATGDDDQRRRRLLPNRAGIRGLVFGLVAGAVLVAVDLVATTLVENANARLVGHGVTVEFLSFWGLHLALALLAFAPIALVTGLLGPAIRADGDRPWGGLLADGAVVAGVSGLLVAATGVWWGMAVLAGLLAAVLWLLAPALGRTTGLPRRLVWPSVLLLAAVWNYASLRDVYDRAEQGWLESKGQLVAATDPDWSRYLLGDALAGMGEADATRAPVQGWGPWRDEAAWRLWRDSSLGDLGVSCLVEILGADGVGESLHAVGFMGDFQYELASRTPWLSAAGNLPEDDDGIVYQTEHRRYNGGDEEILVGEIPRDRGGWIRVEIPLRSWRIPTLLDRLVGARPVDDGGYRPRSEIDREILLLHADDTGWLAAGDAGFPGPDADGPTARLRSGAVAWADLPLDDGSWRCVWIPLSPGAARTPGEGFMLGLRRSGPWENLLDLSRLMLLDLVLWLVGMAGVQAVRSVVRRVDGQGVPGPWRLGFQERFLGGYLLIGLVLLALVGGSVDRASRLRIREDARDQTRDGLEQVVDQLRSLLVEQARSLAASEYIDDLLVGQLAEGRTVGPMHLQQAILFAADGTVLLDETLSDLDSGAAADLLDAARRSPLVLMDDGADLFLGTVIPIDLGGVLDPDQVGALAAGAEPASGFFFYRQRLDAGIVGSLADLVRGELDLRVGGRTVLTSEPEATFSGRSPRLADPTMMTLLLDHPAGATVFVDPQRPFAFTGYQPLPVFTTAVSGRLDRHGLPGILAVTFPDRERVHNEQRRRTVLFLAGLANIILLTALMLVALLSWNVFRPLRLLVGATRSLARGDYAAPLPEAGHEEVGRLADAFARMRDDLGAAQERVAARERFLTTVLDRVTVGVLVIDVTGELVALNPTGRGILDDFHPAEDEELAATDLLDRFRDLRDRQGRPGGELPSVDGRRTLRGALAPLDLPDGRSHTMLVFEDVTEYLENQKLALNAELARQVAHEIKNPLTPIQLSAQLVRQAWQDQHPRLESIIEDAVTRILDQVELLRRIAGEFSLLGRPDDLVAEPLDLRALAAETVAAYAGGDADGPEVTLETTDLPSVLGDTESLRKVLGNLMQNSLDAALPGEPARIDIHWETGPATVTMVWRDRGTGVPTEVAGRLFDPYFSTKSKGTGLGLAICRNLVDRMGGRISLANRDDGAGAEAFLVLRRSDTDGEIT